MPNETETRLALKDKVDLLRDQGIDVYDWWSEVNKYIPVPCVFFRGDEKEGRRALEIMQEHGVAVWELQRHWVYEGCEEPKEIRWFMSFWFD